MRIDGSGISDLKGEYVKQKKEFVSNDYFTTYAYICI